MMRTEFLLGRELPAVFFHEPELPTGFPDLVAVYLGREVHLTRARLRLREAHVRVLHYLHTCDVITTAALAEQLRLRPKKLKDILDQLQAAELVSIQDDAVRARPLARTFAVKYIIAIEAKVRDWSRALEQAAANHWFASHSYILVPQSRSLSRIASRAQELGIGVLVFNGGKIHVAACARRRDIPASYGSWLFNEWAIRRVKRI
jgi:hypothetical protein